MMHRLPPEIFEAHLASEALGFGVGLALSALLTLFGASDQQALLKTVAVLHFSGAAFFPPAFLALWGKPSDERSTRAKACRFLRRISFVK